jgi:hypothetical protein
MEVPDSWQPETEDVQHSMVLWGVLITQYHAFERGRYLSDTLEKLYKYRDVKSESVDRALRRAGKRKPGPLAILYLSIFLVLLAVGVYSEIIEVGIRIVTQQAFVPQETVTHAYTYLMVPAAYAALLFARRFAHTAAVLYADPIAQYEWKA